MAAINQIKLNSTGTTYDVNDKRISTTAVSTATHFLATDGSVSSIAPITAANAASVLGGSGNYLSRSGIMAIHNEYPVCLNPNDLIGTLQFRYVETSSSSARNIPTDIGDHNAYCLNLPGPYELQLLYVYDTGAFYSRMKAGTGFNPWCRFDNFGCNTLSALKSALNAL